MNKPEKRDIKRDLETVDRRKLLGVMVAGGVAVPMAWKRPVVDTVVLPAHAATTGSGGDPGEGIECMGELGNIFACVGFIDAKSGEEQLVGADSDLPEHFRLDVTYLLPAACCNAGTQVTCKILAPPSLAGTTKLVETSLEGGDSDDEACFAFGEFSTDNADFDALIGKTAVVEIDAGECGGVCTAETTIVDCNLTHHI
jgi:hypothetical protein